MVPESKLRLHCIWSATEASREFKRVVTDAVKIWQRRRWPWRQVNKIIIKSKNSHLLMEMESKQEFSKNRVSLLCHKEVHNTKWKCEQKTGWEHADLAELGKSHQHSGSVRRGLCSAHSLGCGINVRQRCLLWQPGSNSSAIFCLKRVAGKGKALTIGNRKSESKMTEMI